ncbi:MAG: hypothetical protein QOE90_1448 [Thermoplasmata archaeon]|jgi:four helix bundle protein|nr:hypothetical protein [Thermoplasmata archaeon]
MPAPHESLIAYQRGLDAAVLLFGLARELPPAHGDLRDQLRRAASSIVLNLAEGAAEYRPAEKARFYRMSRRSTAECLAILDLTDRTAGVSTLSTEARPLLGRTMALTHKLIVATSKEN